MTLSIIGGLGTLILLLFFSWVRARLQQADADREARDVAELETKVAKEALRQTYKIQDRHEKRLREILAGVSDERAGQLLSRSPGSDPDAGAPDPKDGDRGGPAVP